MSYTSEVTQADSMTHRFLIICSTEAAATGQCLNRAVQKCSDNEMELPGKGEDGVIKVTF